MVKLKFADVDRYLEKPDAAHPIALIYGQDIGLIGERADKLASFVTRDNDDPFCSVTIESGDLVTDPQRLADEAYTVPLFGGKRAIRVRVAGGRSITSALDPVLAEPPRDAVIILEAGDLKPANALRKRVEASGSAVAIPCYPDSTRDLERLIAEWARQSGFSVTGDAKDALLELLGGDRRASRAELEKLRIFATGCEEIDLSDVRAVVGDASAHKLDDLVHASLCGHVSRAQSVYRHLLSSATAPATVQAALQRQFQLLHRLRAGIDAGRSPQAALDAVRPPLFRKRRDNVMAELAHWRQDQIEMVLARLHDLSVECRLNAALAPCIIGSFILSISRRSFLSRTR